MSEGERKVLEMYEGARPREEDLFETSHVNHVAWSLVVILFGICIWLCIALVNAENQRYALMTNKCPDPVFKTGVDKAKFLETWNSFGVMTKLRRLPQVTTSYQVSGTPTLIVDGKYQTSPGQVAEKLKINDRNQILQANFQVLDALVAKAAATK